MADRNRFNPSEKDISPFSGMGEAYGLYDQYVQQPVSKAAKKITDEIIDLTTPAEQAKPALKETTGPAIQTGLEMALDPSNLVAGAKIPLGIGAGILARKEADKLNKLIRQGLAQGDDFRDILYRTLKIDQAPYKGTMGEQYAVQELSDKITDLTGAAAMERFGMVEDPNLANFIKKNQSKILEIPQERTRIVGPYGKTVHKPEDEVESALSQARDYRVKMGQPLGMAEAVALKKGDPYAVGYNLDQISPENRTPHFMTGVISHEAPHLSEYQAYGPLTKEKISPYDFSVGEKPQKNLAEVYEKIRTGHHVESKPPIELTQLEALLKDQDPYKALLKPEFRSFRNPRSYSEIASQLNKTYSGRESELLKDIELLTPEYQKNIKPLLNQTPVDQAAIERFEKVKTLLKPK